MGTSYYIKRDRIGPRVQRIAYWHNRLGWNEGEAKGYSTRARAEKVLMGLIAKCKAFADECSIEESVY